MSDLFVTLNERSSIRAYKPEMPTEDEIKCLVEAALKAPTATNRQEIHVTVVKTDNPVVKELQNDLKPDAPTTFYYDAPLLFFLSGEEAFRWSAVDAGIAVENMHLAAKGLGLGSVIIGCVAGILWGEKKEYYAEKLQFPEGYTYQIALAVGYPAADKPQHTYDFDAKATYIG